MRMPIKLNRSGWPNWLTNFVPAMDDPRDLCIYELISNPEEFSKKVSVFKLDSTFKTTNPNRHPLSNNLIYRTFLKSIPVMLDIGASDGSTSIDLIRTLGTGFKKYFVTDLNLTVYFIQTAYGNVYFYNLYKKCFLYVTKYFLIYADTKNAIPIFNYIAESVVKKAPFCNIFQDISLIQPELRNLAKTDPRIEIKRFNMFEVWDGPKPDLIKVANVLNRSYFSDEEIIKALTNFYLTLRPGGRLLIIDNRNTENASLFVRSEYKFVLESSINNGVEISSLVLSLNSRK